MIDFKGLDAATAQPVLTHFGGYGGEKVAVMGGVDVLVIVTGRHLLRAAARCGACVRGAGLMAGSLGNAVDALFDRNVV